MGNLVGIKKKKIQLKKILLEQNHDNNCLMDFYCERTNQQIFNEPINAISNIFFIIVSLSLIKNTQKKNQK